jgi:lysozyme family protein|tara:strand:+ start:995 stop:1468 length:474 start_codon:yes stop_codon:yes gene_type:complete
MTFEEIIDKVIESEGGYVDDPDDSGGQTKYGISHKAYPEVDIKNLTVKEAKQIYYEDYWIPSKSDSLPDQLKEIYFDMVVNFGRRGGAKVLQQACNGKNTFKIKVDGRVGPATISASKNVEPDRLRSYRVLKFASIVIKKPTMEKYWFGWFKRAIRM